MLLSIAEIENGCGTFTPKTVHLGMDEALTCGRGQHYVKNGDKPYEKAFR